MNVLSQRSSEVQSVVPASEYDALLDLFLWLANRNGDIAQEVESDARLDFGEASGEAEWVRHIFKGWRAAEFFDA